MAYNDSMDANENVRLYGTDIVKGYDIKPIPGTKEWEYEMVQGYWNQGKNTYERHGHRVRRVSNTAIDENNIGLYLLGMATASTLENDPDRIVYDAQYHDYAKQMKNAVKMLGHGAYASQGLLKRPFHLSAYSELVTGGGMDHSYADYAWWLQTPPGVDYTVATYPESVYKRSRYDIEINNNPSIIIVPKTTMFGPEATFDKSNPYQEPGHAREAKKGTGLQIVSYGGTVNKAIEILREFPDNRVQETTGILDVESIKPFPSEDLYNFLEQGTGPVMIMHEEPVPYGIGAQIAAEFVNQYSRISEVVVNRNRPVIWVGSYPTGGPPCDRIVSDEVILTKEKIYSHIEDVTSKKKFTPWN